MKLVLISLLLTLCIYISEGCSCLPATFEEKLCRSDAVLIGVPVYKRCAVPMAPFDDQQRCPAVVYGLSVNRMYKGRHQIRTRKSFLEIRTGPNSAACGVELNLYTPYLLTASFDHTGALFVNLCSDIWMQLTGSFYSTHHRVKSALRNCNGY